MPRPHSPADVFGRMPSCGPKNVDPFTGEAPRQEKRMRKRSKRYRKNAALVDPKKRYGVADAVGILKKFEGMKFDQTVDVSFALLLDVKKAEQALRGAVSLPHG